MSDQPQPGLQKPAPTAPPQRPEKPAIVQPQANAPKTKTVKVAKTKPAGWFSFTAKGIRAAVLKSVQDSKELPDGWKGAIIADISSLDATVNFVDVHCHRHQQGGKAVVHFTISGSSVLS